MGRHRRWCRLCLDRARIGRSREHLRQHGVPIRMQGLDEKRSRGSTIYEGGWSSLMLGERSALAPNTVVTPYGGPEFVSGQGAVVPRRRGRPRDPRKKRQHGYWRCLAVLCLSVIVMGLDDSILSVALPSSSSGPEASGRQDTIKSSSSPRRLSVQESPSTLVRGPHVVAPVVGGGCHPEG